MDDAGVSLGPRTLLTNRGGFATLLRNTGEHLVNGTAVSLNSDYEKSVKIWTPGEDIIGFAHGSIYSGVEGWIVTSGIARVRLQAGVDAKIGDVVIPGTLAGFVKTRSHGIPELGHCLAISSDITGTFVDVLLHFI